MEKVGVLLEKIFVIAAQYRVKIGSISFEFFRYQYHGFESVMKGTCRDLRVNLKNVYIEITVSAILGHIFTVLIGLRVVFISAIYSFKTNFGL